jgi:hypothetical protein
MVIKFEKFVIGIICQDISLILKACWISIFHKPKAFSLKGKLLAG